MGHSISAQIGLVVFPLVIGLLVFCASAVETHEEAVFEGYAHIEGRESGRPLAVAARLRQGKRSRRAIIEAAGRLYIEQPLLVRNDSRTAALIEDMKLEALRKRDGTYVGAEAIAKHLRAARRDGKLGKFN